MEEPSGIVRGPFPGTAPARSTRPARVLLLHGFASSPRVMGPLARFLHRRLGRPTLRWAISPGREDLRRSASALARRLDRLDPGRLAPAVDVVAHSMGGLVAAYWLKRFDRGRRIARVVTLGTPYLGTPLARPAAWLLGEGRPALRQMCPESPLLAEIAALAVPDGAQLVSVAGGRDVLVGPERTRIDAGPRSRNLCLPDASHWSLLLAAPALETVARLLEEPGRVDAAQAGPLAA